jgi:hypothetical protein
MITIAGTRGCLMAPQHHAHVPQRSPSPPRLGRARFLLCTAGPPEPLPDAHTADQDRR